MSGRPLCPCCGRTMPALKAVPPTVSVDTSTMTDRELYAHYKRTAITEDLRFFLRLPLSAVLRARADLIAGDKPKARDLASLHAEWRQERADHDRFTCTPAIGSPAWREALLESDAVTAELEVISA